MEYATRTQHYLKVKKPQLERQRRARISKCLDAMKHIIAELTEDDSILRMDKADMLEATIVHLRQTKNSSRQEEQVESFRNGYINAANEVSRVLASTHGISANMGKAIMTHLGCHFKRHSHQSQVLTNKIKYMIPVTVDTTIAPLSPASSGYCSDMDSPVSSQSSMKNIWRPW